ncbi:WecB/TagA/CpsF family glycosyltransferase [Desulforhabdus sp. TSK]|uniref:WecB/TagA/CpsF family glycosyltransferase n=1 Tax=Desulforhabdus sp. TSK TaxID=2925014 RepID=UPI001FC8AA8C|nr:WecB/TagA/CpsF family glycosyltransferase [Desulforhabdus sp. TSK]GKT08596.1 N-acetylmannosaminyltransferase [Desulforhabdus sp. TSK]
MTTRHSISNIWVDAVTMTDALARVEEFLENGNRLHTIFASNPEKNFSVPRDPLLYESFRTADMLIPDGIGMVLAARFLYGAKLERVPGCELMQSICALSAKRDYPIYIYGAKEHVNKEAVQNLERAYPGIRIAGRANGYITEEGMPALVKHINDSGARILFLALGSPKQEQWIARYGSQLENVRVCQCIGGTLDVLTGNVSRAPKIFCNCGLEWLYRLASEPKRLKRQAILPFFVLRVMAKKIEHRTRSTNRIGPG